MSRNAKIILVVGGTVLFSCVLLCIASVLLLPRLAQNMFVQDPAQAKRIGEQIAEYTLPPGYREFMGMDVFTTQMVVLTPPNNRGVSIILMQVRTVTYNRDQMEEQMRQAMQRQFQGGNFQRVAEEPVTIQGKATTMAVSESQSTRGSLRQATGLFAAKSGIGMIMAMGLTSEWDWQVVKNFCGSIR